MEKAQVRLVTDKASILFDKEKLGKAIGKKDLNHLLLATERGYNFKYAKLEKKVNPSEDMLAFYFPKYCQYIVLSVAKLAKAVIYDEADLKSYLPKPVVGAKPLSKRKQEQAVLEAKVKLLSRQLKAGLNNIPLRIIAERNYWVSFAYNKLGAIMPTDEEEIDERLIKTYKIYAIAYYARKKLPVPITRALLNHLDVYCPTIRMCEGTKERDEALTCSVHTYKHDNHIIESKKEVDVKCQNSYPINSYALPKLHLGSIITEDVADGEGQTKAISYNPYVSDDVAFVVKTTNSTYDGTDNTYLELESHLEVYLPTVKKEEDEVEEEMTLNELIKIAYSLAISINYTIARLDFKALR